MKTRNVVIGWVVAIVIATILSLVLSSHGKTGSAVNTNYPNIAATAITVGSGCDQSYTSCTGTQVSQLNYGTCYFKTYATSIAASSTATVDCQGTAAVGTTTTDTTEASLTGLTLANSTIVQLSTTTSGTTFGGLNLLGSAASTTSSGKFVISLNLFNGTGASYSWPTTGTATGTATYLIVR